MSTADALRSRSGPGSSGGQAARRAGQSDWVEWAGRFGHVAKAVSYALIAILALQVAFGQRSQTSDRQGVLREVAGKPFGTDGPVGHGRRVHRLRDLGVRPRRARPRQRGHRRQGQRQAREVRGGRRHLRRLRGRRRLARHGQQLGHRRQREGRDRHRPRLARRPVDRRHRRPGPARLRRRQRVEGQDAEVHARTSTTTR